MRDVQNNTWLGELQGPDSVQTVEVRCRQEDQNDSRHGEGLKTPILQVKKKCVCVEEASEQICTAYLGMGHFKKDTCSVANPVVDS